MRRRRRLTPHDRDWHERQMALGPHGLVRDVWGATTWEGQGDLARQLMARWEALAPKLRHAYAYPNPEDRAPRSIQRH